MSAELPGRSPQTPPASAESIVCPGCERELPGTALYCPYCCGDDGRSGATARGAFIGGIFGLLAGGLVIALWSSVIGQDQASWRLALSITLGVGGAGMLIGAIVNRQR